MTMQPLADAAVAEIGRVVRALTDLETAITPDAPSGSPRWTLTLTLNGAATGTLRFGVDADGARALGKAVMMLDDLPPDEAVVDALKEICGQVVGGVSQQPAFAGLRLAQTVVEDTAPPLADATGFTLQAGPGVQATLWVWDNTAVAGSRKPEPAVTFTQMTAAAAVAAPNLDVILDIDLPLTVRFGETELTLRTLARLGPGSIIDLGRSPDDPVDVLVNGKLIARAEVVVVGGNYGVRITEVVSAADRLRTVAA